MTDEPAKTTLAEALSRAQGQMSNAKFDRANPHFRSKYASLAAILDVVRKPLADNGLAVTQTLDPSGASLFLHTTLRHTSGETVVSSHPLPTNVKPQEFGSALTYARRYSLSAMLNISSDEDDDANIAQASNGNGMGDKLTEDQVHEISALLKETKSDIPLFLTWAKAVSIADIRAYQYDACIAMLTKKKGGRNEPSAKAS